MRKLRGNLMCGKGPPSTVLENQEGTDELAPSLVTWARSDEHVHPIHATSFAKGVKIRSGAGSLGLARTPRREEESSMASLHISPRRHGRVFYKSIGNDNLEDYKIIILQQVEAVHSSYLAAWRASTVGGVAVISPVLGNG